MYVGRYGEFVFWVLLDMTVIRLCCSCYIRQVSAYRFSRIRLWLQIFTVPVHVRGKIWGVCILGFTGNDSH